MSGPATRPVLRRNGRCCDARFERLSGLSNGHLMRKSRTCNVRRVVERTAHVGGHRGAPAIRRARRGTSRGHGAQGDLDGVKGVYHINAVAVTSGRSAR